MGSVCSHSAHLFHLLIRPDQARSNLSLPYPRERKPLRPSVGTMQLPRMTALLLLLSNGLCSSEDSPDALNTSTTQSPGVPTTNESVTTPGIMPVTNLETKITTGIPPEGTTNNEPTKMSTTPSIFPLTVSKSEETTTLAVTKNEVFTMEPTVTNHSLSNATSVLASSIKTENQNSIKTTAMSVNIQPKGTSPEAAVLPSRTVTTPKNISPFQDTEDGKNTTTPPIIPSYSSIILPVVIALIVITLLVFTLVGLYRMCWKRDPGMPENGNDQPQSDKESVKLLTVKAISHESGEHSAQGKAKN